MSTNFMDPIPDSEKANRLKRLEELLKLIGGLEESIRLTYEHKDVALRNTLIPMKANYYEKLRRVAYGLPEQTGSPAKKKI